MTTQAGWTIEEHFAAGCLAVEKIANTEVGTTPQSVCHHFDELDPIDLMTVNRTLHFAHLEPEFAAAGTEFLPDRLEAWETVRPDLMWMGKRVPQMVQIAKNFRLEYRGWSWEPRGVHPVSATDIEIIDNRSP